MSEKDLAGDNLTEIGDKLKDDLLFMEAEEGEVEGNIYELDEETIYAIDFSDRKYINRLAEIEELKKDESFTLLKNHIKSVRLIQFPELELKESGQYRVINGYRRCLAIKTLLEEGHKVENIENAYYIHYDSDYDEMKQDSASLGENMMRKDLSSLEAAFKIKNEVDALGKGKREEKYKAIGEKYSMSSRMVQRYYLSYKYPEILHKVISENGFQKVEELYTLIRLLPKRTPESVVETYYPLTREELRNEIKKIKDIDKKKVKPFEFKIGSKSSVIKFNKKLTETEIEMINEFLRTIK